MSPLTSVSASRIEQLPGQIRKERPIRPRVAGRLKHTVASSAKVVRQNLQSKVLPAEPEGIGSGSRLCPRSRHANAAAAASWALLASTSKPAQRDYIEIGEMESAGNRAQSS